MLSFGVLLAGAIAVPLYPPYRIEEYAKREAKMLHNAQARLLITFSQAEVLSNNPSLWLILYV